MSRVIAHLIPRLDGGGAERQLALLATEQSRRGLRVHVGIRRDGEYAAGMLAAGVDVRILGDFRGLDPRLCLRIRQFLTEVQPAVVHTWLPQMDVCGGICAALLGIPWILSERASAAAYSRPGVTLWLRRRLALRARAVVANSIAGAQYWRDRVTVSTVPNAVDVAAIRTLPAAARPFAGRLLLVVGRLDHQKAVDIVLRALASLPAKDYSLLILGEGPLRDELQKLAVSLGIADRVCLRSYQKDWWGLLKVADVLISASRFEGQPNVVLEAMAAGCPLIVSDIPEHREILNNESAAMVAVNDPAALAAALSAVLNDPAGARDRARRARERVDALTVQAAAAAYESIYESVITGVPPKCVES